MRIPRCASHDESGNNDSPTSRNSRRRCVAAHLTATQSGLLVAGHASDGGLDPSARVLDRLNVQPRP